MWKALNAANRWLLGSYTYLDSFFFPSRCPPFLPSLCPCHRILMCIYLLFPVLIAVLIILFSEVFQKKTNLTTLRNRWQQKMELYLNDVSQWTSALIVCSCDSKLDFDTLAFWRHQRKVMIASWKKHSRKSSCAGWNTEK